MASINFPSTPSTGDTFTANGIYFKWDGVKWSTQSTVFVNWVKKTSNYTTQNADRILADTTTATFTITLPSSPSAGDTILIADGGNWATNNLIIARNGNTIEGAAEDFVLDIPGIRVDLVYSGTTWEIYAFTGPAELAPQSGNTGKFLTTNGTVTSWATVDTSQTPSLGVGTPASGVEGEIRATNQITAYFSSDARLKENIKNIQDPLNKINMLNGVTYDWKDSYISTHGGEDGYFVRKHDIGLIAQEVEQVLPEIVAENSEGYKSIKYDRVVALLVEVAKEQQKQIQELREIIDGNTK
jgi:hypothetical protein